MFIEIPVNEKLKHVRFYIEHLPFEILTNVENDGQEIMDWRMEQLQKDYEQYGDYLHSDLYVEKLNPEIDELDGND